MKTRLAFAAGLAGAAWIASSGTASATLDMQKQAKAAGVQVANCLHCHGEKLPKKDATTYNERGKWLIAEKEKRKAEYSVWKPETSSVSASGRSNGARLVSATAAIMKMMNATGCVITYQLLTSSPKMLIVPCCAIWISRRLSEPVRMKMPTSERPRMIS